MPEGDLSIFLFPSALYSKRGPLLAYFQTNHSKFHTRFLNLNEGVNEPQYGGRKGENSSRNLPPYRRLHLHSFCCAQCDARHEYRSQCKTRCATPVHTHLKVNTGGTCPVCTGDRLNAPGAGRVLKGPFMKHGGASALSVWSMSVRLAVPSI